MSTLYNPEETAKDYEPRYKLLYWVVSVTAVIIFSRLWYLQIIKGDELKAYSEKNRVKETKIPAPRGLILDRNGVVMVDNLPGFEATITPQFASRLEETAEEVGEVLEIEKTEILKMVKKSKRQNGLFRPVKIKENLSLDEVYRLKMLILHHPGLDINETILRHYPNGENGAQLFGYVGEITKKQIKRYNKRFENITFEQGDIIGKSGLEQVWEQKIRGKNGLKFNEVDARGRGKRDSANHLLGFDQKEATPGYNLKLTIDHDIQQAAYKAMQREDKVGPRIGSVVAMKSNGEILAWVNSPSYDPNEFSTGISSELWRTLIDDPFKPLRNKIIQDHYPPGSTFKPVVALAALQESVIKQGTQIYSPGQFRFGRRTYHDHTRHGHGNINVKQALERSSNVFFYKLGRDLGIDHIAKYSKLFGLGKTTGINLSDEKPGLIPTKEWKKKRFGEEWQPGENLSNAIGQGFILTTPLQMAVTYNTIGLEGKVYKPILIKQVLNQKNEVLENFSPQLVRDISVPDSQGDFISKENFKIVKKGMEAVVMGDRGTARWYKVPGITMGGKTGTAQVQAFSADQIYENCRDRPLTQRHHGWFGSFAPVEKPEITVFVLAEHACAGSSGGAPVARDIVKAYMEKYHPDWLETKPKKRTAAKKPASVAENQ